MTEPWIAPWRAGLEQVNCADVDCRRLVVAVTVDVHGDCADCAARKRWDWRREQLELVPAGATS